MPSKNMTAGSGRQIQVMLTAIRPQSTASSKWSFILISSLVETENACHTSKMQSGIVRFPSRKMTSESWF